MEVYASHPTIAESSYILCRRKGLEFSENAIRLLKNTRYVTVSEVQNIDETAAHYKCARKLSLPDCYVLAVAKELRSAALFVRRETELDKEIERKEFDVPIRYVEDLANV
jgi:predicted nucleic acid-binding protein